MQEEGGRAGGRGKEMVEGRDERKELDDDGKKEERQEWKEREINNLPE